jgi:hypothetical protein
MDSNTTTRKNFQNETREAEITVEIIPVLFSPSQSINYFVPVIKLEYKTRKKVKIKTKIEFYQNVLYKNYYNNGEHSAFS